MKVYVNGISVVGPGMIDPEKTLELLRGDKNWTYDELPLLKPSLLPANERRRTTHLIKLALECIQHLLREQDNLSSIESVFASSDGDMEIVDKMCSALASEQKIISPTVFHNSVHNAPAGYWSIAASMSGGTTSISAGDSTFMVGLMEAITRVMSEDRIVMYVAYDYPAPDKIYKKRAFDYPLSVALRLGPTPETGVLGTLKLKGIVDSPETRCRNTSLEELRQSNPSGQGLPLVEAICRRARMKVGIPYLSDTVYSVEVSH